MTQNQEPASVSRFRKYLQIKSVHPKPDYESIKNYLIEQADEIGLEHQVVECVEGKPVIIIKLAGSDPTQKSILLSSHTDVVPVFEDQWKYPPFAAERVFEDGEYRIYARGSQDMKAQGFSYMEALRAIKNSGQKLTRNVFAIYAPDEEIGGADGVGVFSETKEFEALNAGFDIDEGISSPENILWALGAERLVSAVKLTAHGNTGHGSQFIEGTAIEKLLPVINAMMALREEEKNRLETTWNNKEEHQGEVTAVNLTILEGGKQQNVVPATYSATFDIRVSPRRNIVEFRKMISDLAEKHGVECQFPYDETRNPISEWDSTNPFFSSIESVCTKYGRKIVPTIFPAATDARYVRYKGIPAIGMCPFVNLPPLAHAHNEYVTESEYLKAISFYIDIVNELANV
ncbi:Aminoacylase-1A [Zancudomyces culisetae]|uniref:N-acyl-aliphatic-L-amino acid amidohydrolase n=1 Tax=Zancudomyces culisetae TaxID=1213189 RepID=A0A1R1PE94_ZANCU|nr:Aminoacylase-1A [Zancudomyces culisetae]|eukprot:OMH79238.1 Aminoacylase-1A [Zancudomyces culisetae]